MKRRFATLFLAVLFLSGCVGSIGLPPEGVIEISERFFVLQSNEILLNRADYLGRTIQYEGMFRSVHWPPTDQYYHYVIRYTDDCCGAGGMVGFEVRLTGDMQPLEHDAWAKVIGVLEEYVAEDGITYLRVALIELIELEERGEEFVRGM